MAAVQKIYLTNWLLELGIWDLLSEHTSGTYKVWSILYASTVTYTAVCGILRTYPTDLEQTIRKNSNNKSKQQFREFTISGNNSILIEVELIYKNRCANPEDHDSNCILFLTCKCIMHKYYVNNTRCVGLDAHLRITSCPDVLFSVFRYRVQIHAFRWTVKMSTEVCEMFKILHTFGINSVNSELKQTGMPIPCKVNKEKKESSSWTLLDFSTLLAMFQHKQYN
jgi:hypothetical protein